MKQSKALKLAEKGITGDGLSGLLSALIADVYAKTITPKQCKSLNAAIGKLQKKYKVELFSGSKWRLWDSSIDAVPADFLTPTKDKANG